MRENLPPQGDFQHRGTEPNFQNQNSDNKTGINYQAHHTEVLSGLSQMHPYVSIRQHTSAYVSLRQHTHHTEVLSGLSQMHPYVRSAYVSIRPHTSAYVIIHITPKFFPACHAYTRTRTHAHTHIHTRTVRRRSCIQPKKKKKKNSV
jgi:hypothetical protein